MARFAPAIALLVAGCDQVSNTGKVLVAGGPVAGIEAYCALADDDRCGQVYACATDAENELGQVEICVSDSTDIAEVEAAFGPCELSPHDRFDALGHRCFWHCDEGAGCNAFNGCFCPTESD